MSDKLQKIFDSMPTDGDAKFFDNEMFTGICIKWSEKGRGFGEYTFSVDKRNGEFSLDNEMDGPTAVWRVIERLIDTNPAAIKSLFMQMMRAAKVEDDHWSIAEPTSEDNQG